MGSATKSGSEKGSRGNAPCRVKGQRPLWGLGQRPNCSSSNLLKGRSQQGAGSEASLPVTSRVLRRAPKPLYPTTVLCRAKWARPRSCSFPLYWAFPEARGFRLCGGESGALRSPPTPLRSALPCYLIFVEAFYDDAAFSQTSEFQPARRFFAHAPACSCASVSITASEAFG